VTWVQPETDLSDLRIVVPHSLNIRVLGPPDITCSEGAVAAAVLSQPKRLALLVYLAMAPHPHFRRRDTVVALFWPELNESHARGALRQALRFLRQDLGADAITGRGLNDIGVSRTALQLDSLEFERAVAAADAETAIALYQGDLLDGVHVSGVAEALESWIAAERARLRTMARDCARSLAAAAREQHDGGGAVQ
jgi:DNA-binding SARP family transcriptional activator